MDTPWLRYASRRSCRAALYNSAWAPSIAPSETCCFAVGFSRNLNAFIVIEPECARRYRQVDHGQPGRAFPTRLKPGAPCPRLGGAIIVRAYGAEPTVTNHRAALEMRAHIPPIQDLVTGDRPALIKSMAVAALGPRDLANENDPGLPLTDKDRDTVRVLRTMLALRSTP